MIMFIDMDGLKFINDQYGHKEGDQAIIQICTILKISAQTERYVQDLVVMNL